MDTHPDRSDRSNDINDLERRLSAWAPASTGLDADAMLFAAGLAAGQTKRTGSSRFVWPALTGLLSVLVVALGVWLATERSERLLLARQLRQQSPVPVSAPALAPSPPVAPSEPSIGNDAVSSSYLTAHRALEQGVDAWPAAESSRTDTPGLPVNMPVLQVGHRDALLEQ